jgi:methyl halide transferase
LENKPTFFFRFFEVRSSKTLLDASQDLALQDSNPETVSHIKSKANIYFTFIVNQQWNYFRKNHAKCDQCYTESCNFHLVLHFKNTLNSAKKMIESQLDEKYWDERYKNQETGWDIGYVSTPLKEYFNQIKDLSLKILIPGCGPAHEALYLAEKGFHNVTVIDLSQTVIDAVKTKHQAAEKIRFIKGDFFELNETFDLVIEQTFFCALNPELRPEYVKKMSDIIKPEGKLVGLLFNTEFEKKGPPFGGNIHEYNDLFRNYFDIKTMETAYNSIPKRLNTELFIKFIKK